VEKGLWEKGVGKDASAKGLGSRDRTKRGVYTKEREGVFIVERRKGEGTSICGRSTTKRVYPTLQVTANFTSAFCSKKGRQKKDGTRLPPYKPIDSKEQIPITAHCRHPRWGREKEGVYKVGSEMGLQQCQN